MFDNPRYRVAGPAGGPGVLGPWAPTGSTGQARNRHSLGQTGSAIRNAITHVFRARAFN